MPADYRIELLRSRRKTIAVQITAPDCVTVRAPLRMPASAIDGFLRQHAGWIETHLQARRTRPAAPALTAAERRALAEQAAAALPGRIAHFAPLVGVSYGRITIRCQKTRWGSCSAQGNLNFNCLLMLCPPDVRDYVVVHELCHRREMNHSPRFWALVEATLPDYRAARQWLKANGPALIGRVE